jgi:signal transduction histidine kinase
VTLRLRDDGRGFDTRQRYSGMGLETMQERARKLEAVLQIRSVQGAGTTITLMWKPATSKKAS